MKNVALITGASSGIGKELAEIHAEQGGDLIVVARSEEKLLSLKSDLESRFGVQVMPIIKDLTSSEAAREVFDTVLAEGVEVEYLVNNAGFGGCGLFHEREWEQDRSMIHLNILALTELSRLFLPSFVSRRSGRILNVSSTASLMPGPLQAVYFATKAYVTSFSNALAEELRGTGVTVTALLPGATETGFGKVSGMDKTKLFQKTAGARDVARQGYQGMLAGKLNVIAGVSLFQRIQLALIPLAPKWIVLRETRRLQEAV